ncbi:MAG: molybdenum cofactor guanylyltransferase MobA [Hyphomicrobiaceae bacterium]
MNATIPDKNIVGILLAGGQSRRMGGGDKGLIDIAGKPMLQHIADRLACQVGQLAINANGPAGRFANFNLPVFPDTLPDNPGPLAGVLAGLRWAGMHAPSASHILTAPTDTPLLPIDLAERLQSTLVENGENTIALAKSDGGRQPVIGLWPVVLADDLEAALLDGVRKVLAWTDRHGTAFAHFPNIEVGGANVDPFFNANTPEELEDARRIVKVLDEE